VPAAKFKLVIVVPERAPPSFIFMTAVPVRAIVNKLPKETVALTELFCEAPVMVRSPVIVRVFVEDDPDMKTVFVTKGFIRKEVNEIVGTFVTEILESIGLIMTSSPATGTPVGSQLVATCQSVPVVGFHVLTAAPTELFNNIRKNSKASLFIRVEPNIW
jgi:hypothetical protein